MISPCSKYEQCYLLWLNRRCAENKVQQMPENIWCVEFERFLSTLSWHFHRWLCHFSVRTCTATFAFFALLCYFHRTLDNVWVAWHQTNIGQFFCQTHFSNWTSNTFTCVMDVPHFITHLLCFCAFICTKFDSTNFWNTDKWARFHLNGCSQLRKWTTVFSSAEWLYCE